MESATARGACRVAAQASKGLSLRGVGRGPVPNFPVTGLELSRPAADASREAVERWLLD
jgi:hypothetical protein